MRQVICKYHVEDNLVRTRFGLAGQCGAVAVDDVTVTWCSRATSAAVVDRVPERGADSPRAARAAVASRNFVERHRRRACAVDRATESLPPAAALGRYYSARLVRCAAPAPDDVIVRESRRTVSAYRSVRRSSKSEKVKRFIYNQFVSYLSANGFAANTGDTKERNLSRELSSLAADRRRSAGLLRLRSSRTARVSAYTAKSRSPLE